MKAEPVECSSLQCMELMKEGCEEWVLAEVRADVRLIKPMTLLGKSGNKINIG